jgi:hypothetical protein
VIAGGRARLRLEEIIVDDVNGNDNKGQHGQAGLDSGGGGRPRKNVCSLQEVGCSRGRHVVLSAAARRGGHGRHNRSDGKMASG